MGMQIPKQCQKHFKIAVKPYWSTGLTVHGCFVEKSDDTTGAASNARTNAPLSDIAKAVLADLKSDESGSVVRIKCHVSKYHLLVNSILLFSNWQ